MKCYLTNGLTYLEMLTNGLAYLEILADGWSSTWNPKYEIPCKGYLAGFT